MQDTDLHELPVADSVAKGAFLLDAIDPIWFWKVNPRKLHMDEPCGPCGCVLAQHSGEYDLAAYGLSEPLHLWSGTGAPFGFDIDPPSTAGYATLTSLWRDEIDERRDDWLYG